MKDTVRRQEVEVEKSGLEKDSLTGTTGLGEDNLTGTDLEKDRLTGLKK
ncbi:hypothetical protein [Mixta theicola]|nr:hypothetical protein [Mixta theicola]